MKNILHPNSSHLAYLFGGVILLGAVISAIITTDMRWMNWHFSRLGEGGHLSSNIFNFSLLFSSFFLYSLGKNLNTNIKKIKNIQSNISAKAAKTIYWLFSASSICLIGVAIFPFDRFQLIHDVLGYSLLFIFLYLCLHTEKILPIFSKKFYIYCDLVLYATVFCYILFAVLGIISLLAVEFTVFTLLYLWLLQFIKTVRAYID